MEPVTINFNGLNEFVTQFGPFGYVLGHIIAAMFFGVIAWRQIGAAGLLIDKQQEMLSNSYFVRSLVTVAISVANVVIAIFMSVNLFLKALENAN